MDVEALSRAAGAAGAIARAADATGVDFGYLMNAALRESAFNPNARNARSSASGMFQFIEQTWLSVVKQHGAKHGLAAEAEAIRKTADGRLYVGTTKEKRAILNLRFDPEVAAKLAGEFTKDNADFLTEKLGREPTKAELYAAHVLGPKGALSLTELADAQPNARAVYAFPVAARANHSLFYASDGRALSARETLDQFGVMNANLEGIDPAPAKSEGLRGRFADPEDDGSAARAAFMEALMQLQASPIGFTGGGFGDHAEDTTTESNTQALWAAFKQRL
jgi:hypothetical protein